VQTANKQANHGGFIGHLSTVLNPPPESVTNSQSLATDSHYLTSKSSSLATDNHSLVANIPSL